MHFLRWYFPFALSPLLEFMSASVASCSEPWCAQNESVSSVTYGDLAIDDDLFGEADFNRISL